MNPSKLQSRNSLDRYSLEEQVALESLAEDNQNIKRGLIGGGIVGVLCSSAWASVTLSTGMQHSFSALVLGAIIGYSMWLFGNAMDDRMGLYAAGISIGSIVFGNAMLLPAYVAYRHSGLSYFEALGSINLSMTVEFLIDYFEFVDIVFYSMAAYAAYRLSFKELDKQVKQGIVTLDQLS